MPFAYAAGALARIPNQRGARMEPFAYAAGGKGPPGPLHPRPGALPLGTPN